MIGCMIWAVLVSSCLGPGTPSGAMDLFKLAVRDTHLAGTKHHTCRLTTSFVHRCCRRTCATGSYTAALPSCGCGLTRLSTHTSHSSWRSHGPLQAAQLLIHRSMESPAATVAAAAMMTTPAAAAPQRQQSTCLTGPCCSSCYSQATGLAQAACSCWQEVVMHCCRPAMIHMTGCSTRWRAACR
jgi:hypothetical protein